MTTQDLQRLRDTAMLMEVYADERQPNQATRIHEAILTIGESVESARMVARYDYATGGTVQLLRKTS